MSDTEERDFKISLDDESPDLLLHEKREEIKEQKLGRLSQKITLIAILLPCIIGVAMLIAYIDVRKKIAANMDEGSMVVTNLSKDINEKIASFASRLDGFEKKISQDLSAKQESIESVAGQVKKLKNSIASIETSKIDKQELTDALTKIEEKISPVQETIENYRSEIKTFNGEFKKDLLKINASLNDQIENNKKMQADFSSLKAANIDKNELENRLASQKEQYLKEIRDLEAEINWLKNKIKTIEGRATSSQSTTHPAPQKAPAPEPEKSVGEIIEQDIR